ncbi:hypothetical protein H1S01_05810 [Heliobacterium chlorum]|uniref:Spo0E like sporulation regulatory protein n=1 Tax=Heliobacterium chlorum TaxID=2698 RepID=A0ABR7T1L6_HELCL|nr:aspartyl-phosphate phosphatase Spo0E family protein [Heliobacterium chlorum]MBC9784027.1 hypothetical protein [Heliobacterium chlorum]
MNVDDNDILRQIQVKRKEALRHMLARRPQKAVAISREVDRLLNEYYRTKTKGLVPNIQEDPRQPWKSGEREGK